MDQKITACLTHWKLNVKSENAVNLDRVLYQQNYLSKMKVVVMMK
jgi:hypothetical protein